MYGIIAIIASAVIEFILILLTIKEAFNLRDFIYTFRCDHCGNVFHILERGMVCNNCHRKYKEVHKCWDHYLTFRVSSINTELREKFEYKKCIKPFIVELIVDGTGVITVALLAMSIIWGN